MINSDQVARSIVEINRKKYIISMIKTAIWWGISIVAMLLIGQSNDILNSLSRPGAFYSVLLVLLIIPVLRYRLYRALTRPSFFGTVYACSDIIGREPRTDINIGTVASGWELEPVEVYSIKVEDPHRRTYSFVFSSEVSMGYARQHIPKGSRVRYAFGGRYPWNEDSTPDVPFCPNCGQFGSDHETYCSCGCLFLKDVSKE